MTNTAMIETDMTVMDITEMVMTGMDITEMGMTATVITDTVMIATGMTDTVTTGTAMTGKVTTETAVIGTDITGILTHTITRKSTMITGNIKDGINIMTAADGTTVMVTGTMTK